MPTLEETVTHLLSRNRKIEAVKEVREHTGWGLKESKDYVDAIQRGEPVPAITVETGSRAPRETTGEVGRENLAELARTYLQKDQKLRAIKEIRQQTGWGLKEAKEYVERIEASAGAKRGTPDSRAQSAGDMLTSNRRALIMLLIAAGFVVLAILLFAFLQI